MRRVAVAVLLLLGGAGPSAAQTAPLFLEPTHWSNEALRKLGTLGLLPAVADPAAAPVTRNHAARAFEHALLRADSAGSAAVSDLIRGYLALLNAEGEPSRVPAVLRVTVGWQSLSGEARGGDGYFREEDWQGAQPLPDVQSAVALLETATYLRPWLSAAVIAGHARGDWVVPAAAVAVAAGPFDAWAGRRRLHFGLGRGGGTVLGTGTEFSSAFADRAHYTFDGVGLQLREPFRFPGFLRPLGSARLEVAGGRLPRNGNVRHPYVAFGRLIGHPFSDRITLGINRGAIFGGEGNPITGGRLLGLLIGLHGGEGGEFENQIFSTLLRYRPPLGPLPLELYAEWGMDDTAGAVRDMPGVVAGIDIAALPGLPALSLGVERASFPESCCGNPIWYRSIFFRGSWADEGRLFAHPLGGHGSEWLAHAALDLPQHGLLVRARALRRYRGEENLFSPGRTGVSHGGAASLEYGLGRGTRLLLAGSLENATGWSTHRFSFRLSHFLH